jgi:hypothetical protein
MREQMGYGVTHERDLRSLERPGLLRVFAPLDAEERLPRELVVDPGVAVHGAGRRFVALLWPAGLLVGLAAAAWAAKRFG